MSTINATRVVRFLGLSEEATMGGDTPVFPLGLLYPYTRDLRRVCADYETLCEAHPDLASTLVGDRPGPLGALSLQEVQAVQSYMDSIATLHRRIAFAPAGASVGAAYGLTRDRIAS